MALKIVVASESSNNTEASILSQIQNRKMQSQSGHQFIPSLLASFSITGVNGRHNCLVREAAGCSLADSKETSINLMFPIEAARSIAVQLLIGVAFLTFARNLPWAYVGLRNKRCNFVGY